MTEVAEFQEERRLQVQTYYNWAAVAANKAFPTLADMEGLDCPEMKEFSFAMSLEEDVLDPELMFIGPALLEDCRDIGEIRTLRDVPQLSLLSRLTERYLQCIANRAPVGFEAQFVNRHGVALYYRGIVLPLARDGETIDHVWGTINCKPVEAEDAAAIGLASPDRVDDAAPEPGLSETIAALSRARQDFIARVGTKLQDFLEIDGVEFAALVDLDSRSTIMAVGELHDMNPQKLVAGHSRMLGEKMALLKALGLERESVDDILISLADRYYLIRPVSDGTEAGLFVSLVLDRERDNLAMTRFKVTRFSHDLIVK